MAAKLYISQKRWLLIFKVMIPTFKQKNKIFGATICQIVPGYALPNKDVGVEEGKGMD